jgi:hypothetical protein
LTRELERIARPADPTGVFDRVGVRRARRVRTRRIQAALLAGAVIAATTGGFLALQRAFDEGRRNLGDQTGRPLPGNGEIVFSQVGAEGRLQLFVAQPDGSGTRVLTEAGAFDDLDPAVSPDGTTVAFQRRIDGEGFVIAAIPISGGEVTELTDRALALQPAWSPDGSRIAFVGSAGQGSFGLWVMDDDGSNQRRIAGSDSFDVLSPTWSPDGSRIAFVGFDDGAGTLEDIFSVTPDGAGLTRVTDTPGNREVSPGWSPGGRTIAFVRTGGEIAGSEIWTIRPDGSSAALVERSDSAILDQLAWSPDGTLLLAIYGGWIHRVDLAEGGFVRVVEGTTAAWQPLPANSASPSPSPETRPSPGQAAEGVPVNLAGVPFPVCRPMWIPGDFGGDGPEEVIVFEETSGAGCSSIGRSHLGIRDAVTGAVTSYSGPIPQILTRLRAVWPYSTPDFDGDGIDEVAFAWTDEGGTSLVLFRLAILTGDRPGDARVFEPIEWACGPGCDRYQPVTIGRVEKEATSGMYCGRFEVPSADEQEGIVQWSTGLQTELGVVRAYRYRFEDGIMHFETSASWSVEAPDVFPPTGARQLCGSPAFWPTDFPPPASG